MARKRMIHRDIWHSYEIKKCNLRQRILFIGLITIADDEGKLKADTGILMGNIFPFNRISRKILESDLVHLDQLGLVYYYAYGDDNNKYVQIVKWNKYQKVDHPIQSRIPSFENNSRAIREAIANSSENFSTNSNPNSNSNLNSNIKDIISYLNLKTGKNFRSDSKIAVKNIIARLNEKYTIEDFKKVIDIKCSHWLNPKKGEPDMSIYLSPDTLFGNKFEKYLNQNANREAIKEAKTKEKEWKAEKDNYEWKPIPLKVKEQTHKVLNIPDRDKLNKITKGVIK